MNCVKCGGETGDGDDFHPHDAVCIRHLNARLTALEAAFVNDRPGPNMRKIMERVSALESRQKPEPELPDVDKLSGEELWAVAAIEVGFVKTFVKNAYRESVWWSLGELEMVMREKWKTCRYSSLVHCGWSIKGQSRFDEYLERPCCDAIPDDYARAAVKVVRRIKAAKEASDGGM